MEVEQNVQLTPAHFFSDCNAFYSLVQVFLGEQCDSEELPIATLHANLEIANGSMNLFWRQANEASKAFTANIFFIISFVTFLN